MYKHVPFNERKQNAHNYQTILSKNEFFYKIENKSDDQMPKPKSTRQSCKDIRKKLSEKNLNFKENIKLNPKSSTSLNKFDKVEENDFDNLDAQEKEIFLKLRGKKLKDYLSEFLNKNEMEDKNDEEEENQMENFSLDFILEDDMKSKNNKLLDNLLHCETIHNEKRSRTSAPSKIKINFKCNNQNDGLKFDRIDKFDKPRKLTFSYYNQSKTKLRSYSVDTSKKLSNNFASLIKQKKNINNQNSYIESNGPKTIQSIDSKKLMSYIKKESFLKLTNTVKKKKSFASNSEFIADENSNRNSVDSNYLNILNKQLSTQKGGIKKQNTFQLKGQEKRGFIKFQNVHDSLSDDENEEYLSCQIYPDSKFKEVWDYTIFFITFYTLIYVPYNMAFVNSSSMFIVFIDFVCDVVYITDVLLHFLIPISLPDDKYITSFFSIAKNYITTWFILDFFSSIPLSSVINLMNFNIYYAITTNSKTSYKITTIAKISRIYRMVKLIRLLKLIKIAKNDKKIKYLNIFQNSYRSNLNRLFMFLLYFIVFIHMLSCIWVFVGGLGYPNWIVDGNLSNSSDLDLYVASIYFNLTTIFTIGYGDITSVNNYERIYNIIIMCVGIMLCAFAVSSLSKLFQKKDLKTKKLENNLAFLEDISLKHKLNNKLYSKIKQCLKYDYTVNTEDKFNMLSNLPEIIKIELINEMHKDIINSFLFFKNTNSAFRARIMMMLKPLKVLKGEVLIKENEFVEEMFFIKKGVLSVLKNNKKQPLKLIEIRRNEHFGEIFMLMNEKSSFDLVVKSKYAELFFLKKVDLFEIYGEYQSILESILQKSTYNSLMLLKRYKNSVNNIKKRKSVSELNTVKIKINNSEKSIFGLILKKDVDITELDNKRKISANLSDDRPKENILGIPIKENYLPFSPRGIKLKKDFNIIIEENEDEMMMNFSIDSDNINNNDSSVIKNINYNSSPETKQALNSNVILSDLNNQSDKISNSSPDKLLVIRNSNSEAIKFSNDLLKDEDGIQNKRKNLRRFTGVTKPATNSLNFEKLQEITKQFKTPMLKPKEKANTLNIRTNDRSIRRKTMFISKEINKNIINDSMNIKAPAMFYSNKFEKWTLNNQIKKLENILITFQKIVKKVEG